jgi:two-component system chemotaxis response regulator CheY
MITTFLDFHTLRTSHNLISTMFAPETRILLVDDTLEQHQIASGALRSLGFSGTPKIALNGKQALEILAQSLSSEQPIELMITDWEMPEMTGLELVKAVRANPAYAGLAIVMVTGLSAHGQIMEALQAGANNYIVKPLTTEELQPKLVKTWDVIQKKRKLAALSK